MYIYLYPPRRCRAFSESSLVTSLPLEPLRLSQADDTNPRARCVPCVTASQREKRETTIMNIHNYDKTTIEHIQL